MIPRNSSQLLKVESPTFESNEVRYIALKQEGMVCGPHDHVTLWGRCRLTAGSLAWNRVLYPPAMHSVRPNIQVWGYGLGTGSRRSGKWLIHCLRNFGPSAGAYFVSLFML